MSLNTDNNCLHKNCFQDPATLMFLKVRKSKENGSFLATDFIEKKFCGHNVFNVNNYRSKYGLQDGALATPNSNFSFFA